MPRRSDCIYCGAETGSREHTFPAALGGRRMNKGILCGACNERFSSLDTLLSVQLGVLNSLIGVRPDRADAPKPARIETADGPIHFDSTGRPSLGAPRVLAEGQAEGGRQRLSMGFANERQLQEWIEAQRAAGYSVLRPGPAVVKPFSPGELPVQLSFGGEEAFREIGRIALNFLAHRWPELARDIGLREFKDHVQGRRRAAGAPRFVWYTPRDAFGLPEPLSAFEHQILLVVDAPSGEAYSRVRFFGAFDLLVWFGRVSIPHSEAALVCIDPLAEHPPDDIHESLLPRGTVPERIVAPTTDTEPEIGGLVGERLKALFSKIADRQWALGTPGLLDNLNATRSLPRGPARRRQALSVVVGG